MPKKRPVSPGKWTGPPNARGVSAGEIFFEPAPKMHISMLPNELVNEINRLATRPVSPGKWTGPPNASGVSAGEIFKRSRNTKRGGASAPKIRPMHIGRLPSELVKQINDFATSGISGIAVLGRLGRLGQLGQLGQLLHHASRQRALLGLQKTPLEKQSQVVL